MKPEVAELMLTWDCNRACRYCIASNNQDPGKYLPLEALNRQEVQAAKRVIIAGGEPTLHPDILTICETLRDRGQDITLLTNGIKLADGAFVSELITAGVGQFQITLPTHDPVVFDYLTGAPGSYDLTHQALRNIREHRIARLTINTIVTKFNYRNIEDIFKMAPEPDMVSITMLRLSDRVLSNLDELYVSIDEARPYLTRAVEYFMRSGINIAFAYPLCGVTGVAREHLSWMASQGARIPPKTVTGPEGTPKRFITKAYPACEACLRADYCSKIRIYEEYADRINYDHGLSRRGDELRTA
jgi:MoaA/NifB/PqqE/SkfB family radical SAM enzyme